MIASERIHRYLSAHYTSQPYTKFYAFTASPHDKYLNRETLHRTIKDLLKLYSPIYSLLYVIEVSELGKIHAHGIICSRDQSKFVKVRNHPVVQFKIVKYSPGIWIKYILKDNPTKIHVIYKDANSILTTEILVQ